MSKQMATIEMYGETTQVDLNNETSIKRGIYRLFTANNEEFGKILSMNIKRNEISFKYMSSNIARTAHQVKYNVSIVEVEAPAKVEYPTHGMIREMVWTYGAGDWAIETVK